MTAARLLRLYPRAWRARYGDEFLAMFGDTPLRFSQTLDIIAGAVDARWSSDVRVSTGNTAVSTTGGTTVIEALRRSCTTKMPPLTFRDHMRGAAIIVFGSVVLSIVGIMFRRNGFDQTGEFFKALAFPGSLVLSSHATYMKNYSWKAQVAVLETTLLLVGLICYLAATI